MFGYYQTHTQGNAHQIRYSDKNEVLRTYKRLSPSARLAFDSLNPIGNQSGFFFYWHVFKTISFNETARLAYEDGRITYTRYQYLVTPLMPK